MREFTALWLLVHAFLFYSYGIRDQFVDSRRYIEMSDYVLAHGTLEHTYQIFYAIPIILLAIFRLLFGDGLIAFVVFQSILSMIASLALYISACKLFRNQNAGLFAAIIDEAAYGLFECLLIQLCCTSCLSQPASGGPMEPIETIVP